MTPEVIVRPRPLRQAGPMSPSQTEHAGLHVRRWRDQRRRSQLDVAVSADISTRHLSYIETGRSTPSRKMIERICDELDVPLRDRNRSEEHTSELQSLMRISYAGIRLKKKKQTQ